MPHDLVQAPTQLADWEQRYLAQGYEGVMLRHPAGPYKPGRSTAREAWLLKLKRLRTAYEAGKITVDYGW